MPSHLRYGSNDWEVGRRNFDGGTIPIAATRDYPSALQTPQLPGWRRCLSRFHALYYESDGHETLSLLLHCNSHSTCVPIHRSTARAGELGQHELNAMSQ